VDVTEDGIIGPYLTWPLLESVPKPLIPIPPEPPDLLELAKLPAAQKIPSPSPDTLMSLDHHVLLLHSTLPQFQLPLMLEDGHLTHLVSSPTVEPHSITPS